MQISQAGLDLITSFEGYHTALPNGDCTTYYCPAGVLTIGYGCTEGIRPGEVWTKKQAQERFRKELVKHEAAVSRCVTAPMTQHQFDALASFSYNCGVGALEASSLVRRFNAGDTDGCARAFALYNKARKGRGGPLVVLPGLTRRRASETALFLKPDPVAEADEPLMPQAVEPPTVAEEHADAHSLLDEASTLYARHGSAIRTTGWGVPPGLLAIWNWVADPVHLLVLVAGAAFVVVVGLELSRLHQRRGAVGRPA